MSNDLSIRCPVCRARQSARATCRRCRADLTLVVRARRRLAYVVGQLEEARRNGDRDREGDFVDERRWLGAGG